MVHSWFTRSTRKVMRIGRFVLTGVSPISSGISGVILPFFIFILYRLRLPLWHIPARTSEGYNIAKTSPSNFDNTIRSWVEIDEKELRLTYNLIGLSAGEVYLRRSNSRQSFLWGISQVNPSCSSPHPCSSAEEIRVGGKMHLPGGDLDLTRRGDILGDIWSSLGKNSNCELISATRNRGLNFFNLCINTSWTTNWQKREDSFKQLIELLRISWNNCGQSIECVGHASDWINLLKWLVS